MTNYIGVRCPVCSKKFSSSDDIVVCPVCGAPHHRTCYAERGACAFVEDHLSGKEWSPPPGEGAQAQAGEGPDGQAGPEEAAQDGPRTKECPNCGGRNPEENVFCQSCGQRLFAREQRGGQGPAAGPAPGQPGFGYPGMGMDPATMAYGGLRPEEEIDGVKVRELALYIGPNAVYYLPRFAAISSGRSSFLPNFAAFFASFLYFFYRKMYSVGVILLALFLVGMIPTVLYMWEVMPATLYQMGFDIDPTVNAAAAEYFMQWSSIVSTVRLVISISVAMFANRIYYNRTMRIVQELRGDSDGALEGSYREQLALQGGVNRNAVIILIVTLVAAVFVLSGIMMQAMLNNYNITI